MRASTASIFAIICAGASLIVTSDVPAQSSDPAGATTYPRTEIEVAAGIVPTNDAYPAGDVRRYGATGDGRADDTAALRSALNASASVYIARPLVRYKTDQLLVPSNVSIFLEPGTIIEANPGYGSNDSIFRILDQTNVQISGYGATLRMLKDEYDGEYRHGIAIRGSTNVEVEGITSIDTGGDGFYIGEGRLNTYCENVTLRDVVADNNRRQGLSIISGRNIRVFDSRFLNTTGTPPTAGVDIEPNDNTNFMENVLLENIYTEGNDGPGIKIDLRRLAGEVDKTTAIRIVNHVDWRSSNGIYISGLNMGNRSLTGSIEIIHPISVDADNSALTQRNYDALGPRIDVYNPVAIRPNAVESPSSSLGAAILVYRPRTDSGARNIGNIHFHDPVIVDDRSPARITAYFYLKDQTTEQPREDVRNVTIGGRIDATGHSAPGALRMVYFDGSGEVEDTGNLLAYATGNAGLTLNITNYTRTVTNAGSTRPVTVTLGDVPPGWPAVTFEVRQRETLRVDPGGDSRILPGSRGPGKSIESDDLGARLTLRRRSATEWMIEEESGSWSHER